MDENQDVNILRNIKKIIIEVVYDINDLILNLWLLKWIYNINHT